MKLIPVLLLAASTLPAAAQTSADAVKASNEFAFSFYKQQHFKPGENICFSPYSISSAFAMTYAGADKITAGEFQKVFGFSKNEPAFHQGFESLQKNISALSDASNQLNIANRIFPQTGMKLEKDFLSITENQYKAAPEPLNFAGDAENSRQRINSWVEDQTQKRIQNLLPPDAVNTDTRMVLVNALYMKSKWQFAFDKKKTTDKPFYSDGKTITAPLMTQEASLAYYSDSRIKSVEIPYDGSKLSMIIVIPSEEQQPIDSIRTYFTAAVYNQMLNAQTEREVSLFLPRFKAEYSTSLKASLGSMGMINSFLPAADFSKMTKDTHLFISDAFHKTFVEVNEEGTEAAAATAVVMQTDSAKPGIFEDKLVFRADRPFIYIIRDTQSGTILFLGEVHDPSKQ